MTYRMPKPSFRDLFSYKSRATKHLLRRLMRLAEAIAENELVCESATSVEVWFACIAPVAQGYWRSAVPEQTKKEVLEDFHRHVGNIVVNDTVIPTPEFQALDDAGQNKLIDMMFADLPKQFERRAKEYVDAIDLYLLEARTSKALPRALAQLLVRNLFGNGGTDSLIDQSAKERDILFAVAIPMIKAFVESMKG